MLSGPLLLLGGRNLAPPRLREKCEPDDVIKLVQVVYRAAPRISDLVDICISGISRSTRLQTAIGHSPFFASLSMLYHRNGKDALLP